VSYDNKIIPDFSAVLIEPLAAAFNAVYTSPPRDNFKVAVIGPKKLGSLLISALNSYRSKMNIQFKIFAIVRREEMKDICFKMGADEVLVNDGRNLIENNIFSNKNYNLDFDIIYDTSGSEEGFKFALNHSKSEVHLKSTSGKNMCGINNFTAMVVDEIFLMGLNKYLDRYSIDEIEKDNYQKNVIFTTPNFIKSYSNKFNKNIEDLECFKNSEFIPYNLSNLEEKFLQNIFKSNVKNTSRLPRFDLCIVNKLEEIDKVIRPFKTNEDSLVRPRGIILYSGLEELEEKSDNEIIKFLNRGGVIKTSRCGDFKLTIEYLEEDEILRNRIQNIITNVYSVDEIEKAFEEAKSKNAIKVIIKHK